MARNPHWLRHHDTARSGKVSRAACTNGVAPYENPGVLARAGEGPSCSALWEVRGLPAPLIGNASACREFPSACLNRPGWLSLSAAECPSKSAAVRLAVGEIHRQEDRLVTRQ
jgi:hypothetical protein